MLLGTLVLQLTLTGQPTPPPPTPPPAATCGACRSGTFDEPRIEFFWTGTTAQSCCDLCSANKTCAFATRSGTNCFPVTLPASGFKAQGGVTCPTATAPPRPAAPLPLDLWPALSEHGSAVSLPQKGEPGTALAAVAPTLSIRCARGGCPLAEQLAWYQQRLRADSAPAAAAPAGGLLADVRVAVRDAAVTVMLPDTDESYAIFCTAGAAKRCDVRANR